MFGIADGQATVWPMRPGFRGRLLAAAQVRFPPAARVRQSKPCGKGLRPPCCRGRGDAGTNAAADHMAVAIRTPLSTLSED